MGDTVARRATVRQHGAMASSTEHGRWLTVPNAVTLLRLVLVAPLCWLIARGTTGDPWPLVLIAAWASTDWIDGVLARRLGQVSRVGEILDPIADRIGVIAVIITLTLAGHISWWAIGTIAVLDIATLAFAGRAAATGDIKVTWLGKTRTALVLLAVVVIVAAATLWPSVMWLGQALLWAGVVLHVVTGTDYIRRARCSRATRRSPRTLPRPPRRPSGRSG